MRITLEQSRSAMRHAAAWSLVYRKHFFLFESTNADRYFSRQGLAQRTAPMLGEWPGDRSSYL
jgi:hypothetical protein